MTAPARVLARDSVAGPAELRRLPESKLEPLAAELREFLLGSVARGGGHLAAGLGAVELTIALHYVFDTPRDSLVWDVGHQGYPHKVLTGRRDRMHTHAPAAAGCRASCAATRARTTPSAPDTPARRSARRSAWRVASAAHRQADARPWRSSATAH